MNKYIHRHYRILCASLTGSILALQGTPVAHAGEVGDAIRGLADTTSIHEKITLKDLGLEQTITLGSNAAARDIYIPVPADIPLTEPNLALKGRYIRADGGRTTYTLALDGNLVAARSPTDESGSADISIGVDGSPRASGFVRMGLNWSSTIGQALCDDERIIGNALQISPDSYLEYSYDPSAIKDISGVWSALPHKVVLLVSSDKLDAASYDAAWRLGVALERAGKSVKVVPVPQAGSRVDVTDLDVPSALVSVPAFAALANGGEITLSNEAEVGALLLLNAPLSLRANVAVVDNALSENIKKALDAVRQQLVQIDAEAGPALDALYKRTNSLSEPLPSKGVAVRTLAYRPVIAVAPDAAGAASGLFDTLWRRTAISGNVVLNTVGTPAENSDRIPLGSLNEAANSLDVTARGDWTTTFDLGATLAKGKVPASLDMLVSAAPGATDTLPVASVFLNDYLLGARQLTANGQPEDISVDIPSYALQPRNTVRVQFQRQPASDRCRETPQAYPASVQPNSTMRLTDAPKVQDFATLAPQLAGDASVLVPESWRSQATRTLPTVIEIANASGVSPAEASFRLQDSSATVTPEKPFVAFDVSIVGATEAVKVSNGRVSIADKHGKVFYDIAGMDNIAVLQAVTDGKVPGLSYHAVGEAPVFEKPFRLSRGDIAVVGAKGILASANSNGVPLYLTAEGAQGGEPFTWKKLLDPSYLLHNLSWLLTVGLVGLFVILLLLAKVARRRAKKDQA